MLHLIIDILVGATAGFIAGLLGTGNSLVVLPALILIFSSQYPAAIALPLAIGTNLGICGVAILVAAISHHKHMRTDWKILRTTGPAYFIASLLGPWVVRFL